MTSFKTPAIWLLVLIVGLPQFSETVYSPALPQIAKAFMVEEQWAEFTLTIYLIGFAIGTLGWGYISDQHGRKPCLLAGLFIYSLGCLGCYFSTSIEMLIIARLFQAIGGSTGSVLGQAICREAFTDQEKRQVFATLGTALSISPAIGPIIGGWFSQHFDWPTIFSFLTITGLLTLLLVRISLSETHQQRSNRNKVSLIKVWLILLKDKRAMGFCCLIGLTNGLGFSYFAEAPFYMIDLLGLTPVSYGASFILLACGSTIGGILWKRLFKCYSSLEILRFGLTIILVGTSILYLSVLLLYDLHLELIIVTIGTMASIMLGVNLVIISALSTALEGYQSIGTASSIFGFMYYGIISGTTLIMASLHDDTLYAMPQFFLIISIAMVAIYATLIHQRSKVSVSV